MNRLFAMAVLCLALVGMCVAQKKPSASPKAKKTPPPAADNASAALYKSKCQVCHGAEGKGDTPAGKKLGARDFHSPEVAKMSDADLFKTVKEGKDKMPKYEGKLTDDQIKSLVAYIRKLK